MALEKTVVVITHDTGYSDDLVRRINAAFKGMDMRAELQTASESDTGSLATAAKIIAAGISEMRHPSLTREDIDGNAIAIIVRLAHAGIALKKTR